MGGIAWRRARDVRGTRESGEGRHVADKDLEVVEGPA
jgi:hypothetical protein